MLKKILKIILWTVVSIVGLLLLLSVLVYLPPVQNLIKDKVTKIVSKSLGMNLSVGKIRLRFPLTLTVADATLVTAQGDTLAAVGQMKTGVALAPLFTGEITVGQFVLENVSGNYNDTVSNMRFTGSLEKIKLNNINARLKKKTADVGTANITHADVELFLGESSAPADTAAADTTTTGWIFDLGTLDLEGINFKMHTSPQVTQLTARLNDGRLNGISVDLGKQTVAAASVRLDDGDYAYLTDTTSQVSAPDTTQTSESEPWTINVGRIDIKDNAFRYGSLYGTPAPGFDPAHIELSGIDLRIDSAYNRGADVAAVIRSLSANERSGLQIDECEGRFSMDSAGIKLGGFDLRTADSRITADAKAGPTIFDMAPETPVTAAIDATIGMSDAFMFYPADETLRKTLARKPLTLAADVSGMLGNLSIRNLHARLAQYMDLRASGNIRSVTDPGQLSGNLNINASFADIGFVKGLLPDTALRNRIGFPKKMKLAGIVSASRDVYSPNLVITADSGSLSVKGRLDMRSKAYQADITATDFPLGTFLPQDSLGSVSLTLTADGHGFDPTAEKSSADIRLKISRLDYKNFGFSGIAIAATLKDHILKGTVTSNNEALELEMAVDGELRQNFYAAALKGSVKKADMEVLGLTTLPVSIGLRIDASASANIADTAYKANLVIDSVRITHGYRMDSIRKTTLSAEANRNMVTANLLSGDLKLNFKSPESINTLLDGFKAAAGLITEQLDSLDLDMIPVEEALPTFRLDISAERNNPLREYLRTKGMDFNMISVSAGNDDKTPFGAGIIANGFRTGGITLDTLNAWVQRDEERLDYALRIRNKPGNIEQMAFIGVGGDIVGNTVRAGFLQRDFSDSVGFRFGITAQLLDSAVRATMTPRNPIFGYRQWNVNDGNFLTYHFDKRIDADLRLEGANNGQYFRITSANSDNMPPGSVRLAVGGIELGEIFSLFPAPIPIEGTLMVNGAIGFAGPIVKGDIDLGIGKLKYDGNDVGDIDLSLAANTDEHNIWNLDLSLKANGQPALTAGGTYDLMNTGLLNMKVNVPGFPLTIANAFLPSDIARMEGILHGKLDVKGTLDRPELDGGINFENGRISVPMIGTSFGIANEGITIADDRVVLRNFGLIAPNNQRLALDGTVDIGDFSAMKANLRLFAANFQAVNSTRNSGSQVYGKAAIDVDMNIRGLLDALSIRGKIGILSSTNVFYTMRDSPLEVRDAKQDIVTFVSFADQDSLPAADSVPLRRQSSIDMLVNVDIQDNVQATLNLSANGNNRIELIGDGALTLAVNSQGDTRLTGRYTLSGGTVIYSLPVIGTKNFGIDDGSYVNWTGELANPSFNITATEVAPIRVAESGQASRLVNFNVIVNVSNTLQNMKLGFDLSTNNDATIQNELQSLAPEQRSSRAIYMLVTNEYQSDNFETQSSNMGVNQQIGAFVSKELNQWARNNLSGVDVSVGIDNVDDGLGNSHTDYSYSVSKSLFDDRLKVTIGGTVSDNASSGNMSDNLVDDLTLEYRLAKRDNMFLKVYRYNTQETILEGEITETGIGFIVRKKMNRLRELFRLTPDPKKREERRSSRELRQQLREEERESDADPARPQRQDDPLAPLKEAGIMSTEPANEE